LPSLAGPSGASAPDSRRSTAVQAGPELMSSQTLQRKVVITNPQGLHVRPLAAFVRQAMQFQSTITLSKGDRRANGKSALELLSLGVAQGQEVLLEVSGSDAPVALQVLADLLAAPSVDDEPEA